MFLRTEYHTMHGFNDRLLCLMINVNQAKHFLGPSCKKTDWPSCMLALIIESLIRLFTYNTFFFANFPI